MDVPELACDSCVNRDNTQGSLSRQSPDPRKTKIAIRRVSIISTRQLRPHRNNGHIAYDQNNLF